MVKQILAAGLVALTAVSAAAAVPPVRTMYNDAMAKEQAVRKALDNPRATEAILKAVHEAIESYEAVVRRYPSSSYCDNALWQAGRLALDAFARFNQPADQDTGERLLRKLAAEYPSSKLARQVRLADARPARSARLEAAKPIPEPPARATAEPAARTARETARVERARSESMSSERARPEPARPEPAHVETTKPESTPALPASASGAIRTIRDIRRSVMPDAVRVVIELDGEVAFHEERISDPSRVFLDMPGTRASTALQDQTLRFEGDADVVRQVRIGRHPNNTTRVVLDANGVSSYSVYPLYEPYRLVIDCVRATPAVVSTTARSTTTRSVPVPASGSPAPATPNPTVLARAPAPKAAVAAPIVPPPLMPPATVSGALPGAVGLPPSAPVRRDPPLLRATRLKTAPIRSAPSISPQHSLLLADARVLTLTARPITVSAAVVPVIVPKRIEHPPTGPAPTAAAVAAVTPPPLPTTTIATAAAVPVPADPRPSGDHGANGGLSIARQLGLGVSRIVIDAGHGGHDPGAKGRGVTESELVLDVALRLEALLQKQPGLEVILTRRTDDYIQLPDRTALANREGADLFLSIHANASTNPAVHGLETYYLNFATNLSAAAVAARENADSTQQMGALPDFVKAIAMNNKLDESREFANAVQHEMVEHVRTTNKTVRDLGVKQAPFVVLIGAAMPSVLAEISFVTNPTEARLAKSDAYRQKIAEALFAAIRRYQNALKTGTTLATQRD